MNETNPEIPFQEPPGTDYLQPVAKPKRKIPVAAWIAGCLALLCGCAVVVGAFIFFGLPLLQGDPTAVAVPSDSLMYMSMDLAQARSDKFNQIFAIVQKLSDAEEQTPIESFDKFMQDEWDMSFTDDVLPWVGRHAAFAVTEGDLSGGDFKMMFIVETRNKAKADEFLKNFVSALEKNDDMSFQESEENGVTFYIDEADSQYDEPMVLARSGNFVYLSNDQDTVLNSIALKKGDSLAGYAPYKSGLAALPRNRLATLYITETTLQQSLDEMFSSEFGPSFSTYSKDMLGNGMSGIAMSLSIVDQGLRMDTAVVYDKAELTDYQKEMMQTRYLPLKADALVPQDTFIFIGSNPSKAPGGYTEVDNPLYSSDVKESFDLLEKQYGINILDFVDLLSGEVVVAVGPASDGLFSQEGGPNLGMTVLAGTTDEKAFVDWFDNVLDKAFTDISYMKYDVNNTTIADYSLKELTIDSGSETIPALIYGADKGYIIFGTSPAMLENGLSGKKSLADDELYRQTWKAFPRGSVPYMYFNMKGFMEFLVDNSDAFGGASEMRDPQKKLQDIPVIAASMNNPKGSVQSMTIIVFIESNP